MTFTFLKQPVSTLRNLAAAVALTGALCVPASAPQAQDNVAGKVGKAIAEVAIDNKKFEPPQDIRVVTKKEWSQDTPLDAFYGMMSSMIADNPHWQAEGTVHEMREIVRQKAGGKIGQRLHKILNNQISRIAVMQVITRGDTAIVIGLKEHKPNWKQKEVTYSVDVFGFENRDGKWMFHPRRSAFYPDCHVVYLGSMRDPVDHFYCLVQEQDGYFTIDSSIQHDPDFNKAMFGKDITTDEDSQE